MADYVIDYFELPTSDTARSRDFLGKAFGWTFVDYGDAYSEVHGGMVGGLNGDSADRTSAPVVLIRTSDIAKAERDVVAAGGVITRKTYDYPGGNRFFFREPGGAELGMYQPAG
jgi:predicted enzyme related to lactoylglutathione lyase